MPNVSLFNNSKFRIRPNHRCQFHRHFMSSFFVKKKCYVQRFCTHIFCLYFLGENWQKSFSLNVSEIVSRLKNLSETFGQFKTSGIYSNVSFVGKNVNGSSAKLTSNCAVISAVSKLLSNVFECPCKGCDYVIICPDFEVKPLTKVIELIHTGRADVCRQDLESIQGVLDCLQIDQINDQISTLMDADSIEVPGVHDQEDQQCVDLVETDELVDLEENNRVSNEAVENER